MKQWEQQRERLIEGLAREKAALAASEQRYRIMGESIDYGVWAADAEGKATYISPSFCRMIGRSFEEIRELGWLDTLVPDQRDEVIALWTQSVRTGEPFEHEHHFLDKEGQVRIVLARGSPVRDDSGRVISWAGINLDVTERRRADAERQSVVELLEMANTATSSRELARSALEFFGRLSGCSAVGIRLKQGDDFPYYDFRGSSHEFSCREDSLLNRDPTGNVIVDESGNPLIACMCSQVLRGDADPSKPYFTPFGSFWANSTARLLASANDEGLPSEGSIVCNPAGFESLALVPVRAGNTTLGLLHLADLQPGRFSREAIALYERLAGQLAVTLAKLRAEEAMRESENRYRELVQNANSAVIRWKCDGTITFFNEYAQQLFGYSASEILGQHAGIIVPDLDSTGADLTRLVQDLVNHPDRYVSNVNENICRDGRRVWMVWTNKPVVNTEGKVIEMLAIGSDITERKRAEVALRDSREDLNHAQAVAHTGSWRLNVHRNELLWSDENWRIFGVPRDTPLSYETFLATVHPDDRDFVHKSWLAALRGEPYDLEHRIVVGGETKWVRERAELEFDPDGALQGAFGTTQ
ncbi:MAG: PAS domain S-box protein, partial [Planctomycetes bacterium]|nr:PAS domain S-box protein [Planctomycetota bacterium]